MTDEKDKLSENIPCIYVGVRSLTSGKLADGFVLQSNPEQPPSLFERKKKDMARVVGGAYDMKGMITDGMIRTLVTNGGTLTGRWAGKPELVVEWEVADQAAKAKDRERKLVARLKDESKLAQEIATLRRVYHRTPFADRTAFELMVLHELRKSARV